MGNKEELYLADLPFTTENLSCESMTDEKPDNDSTKTKLKISWNPFEFGGSKQIYVLTYEDGAVKRAERIIPDINDVKVIGDGKVLIVTFADGSKEKAVLSDNDTYSLETGISICITKRLLSGLTDGNGSSVYNKLISRALRIKEKNEKEAEKEALKSKEERERRKREEEKRKEKNKLRRQKIIAEISKSVMEMIDEISKEGLNNGK